MQIDWLKIFLHDLDFSAAATIVIKTIIMFGLVLVFLRSSGKKGVRQLSIFEVAIIIALGSAAGDPMLNDTAAIIPSIIAFAAILATYRLLTYLAAKSQAVENVLEGVPMSIIEDGRFTMEERSSNTFAKDEFFAEMRLQNIEHVGQVRRAILETNGQVSFLFFEDNDVRYGLPVLPELYDKKDQGVSKSGRYACTRCANVEELQADQACPRCQNKEWVPAINARRIT
ncbi:DUF421 domain-containing protein [Pedobacter yulinensis]|uniref:DUF421 domain-containing protein n=1 Tax=Pedobacter yulinensis TaxID=2126353 RepID=A0A2T3HJD3_9SPHI|nr:YetF domain-containing protein [Pedobacter yulinensis]PST82503.1 DUF421 domain-containing protein [Pedobacter yulinensis]